MQGCVSRRILRERRTDLVKEEWGTRTLFVLSQAFQRFRVLPSCQKYSHRKYFSISSIAIQLVKDCIQKCTFIKRKVETSKLLPFKQTQGSRDLWFLMFDQPLSREYVPQKTEDLCSISFIRTVSTKRHVRSLVLVTRKKISRGSKFF